MDPEFPDGSDVPLEERRFHDEAIARNRELDLREREIAAKERELSRSGWFSPIVIGLFAAALGLVGNIIVARVNNQSSIQVERVRSQSNLILEAIKTGNPDEACKNLVFFVGIGLLGDQNQTIRNACATAPPGGPALPAPGELANLQGLTGGIGPPPVRVIVHARRADGRDVHGFNVYYVPEKLQGKPDQAKAFILLGSPSEMYLFPGVYVFWAAKDDASKPVTLPERAVIAGTSDIVINLSMK